MDAPKMWIATFETSSTQSRGFGSSPEEAVKALVDRWKGDYCRMAPGADPDLPEEMREEIEVQSFRPGEGYVIAVSDVLWHPENLRGDDTRFDAVFRSAFPAPGR